MAKKIVKRRKLKVFRLFIMLLILVVFIFLVYLFLNSSTKNIIIFGNKYLDDDSIIEMVDLKNYDLIFTK